MPTEPLVEVAGVGKAYNGRTVVAGVTLTVRRGDIVGLVGANGGGKTTTLRILAGLLRADAGAGRVLGGDLSAVTPARRGATGYMGQRLALHADLSVAENLRFHAAVHGLGREAVAQAVARHGLASVGDTRFGELSGGWARRVQFAATVLHAPPLMLLDEPTAGLDVVTRRHIWGWLGDFAAAGHGIVISTHDLQEAERWPSILLYERGRASQQTTPSALIARCGVASLEDAVAGDAI